MSGGVVEKRRDACPVPPPHLAHAGIGFPFALQLRQMSHLGPKDTSQTEIDAAIDNAVQGKNLVACVAMDYLVNSGVNGDQPFTRFFIFSPDGNLLQSVNLDGRREKFVPGVCVVCHGGDFYAGRFAENGSGAPNIGAHFLPYDVGNFEFSDKPGLTKADQQLVIKQLNQNVLSAGPTPATVDLIGGWYAGGSNTFDENYLPSSWQAFTATNSAAPDMYQKAIRPNCRTCHVAFDESYNFDHVANATGAVPEGVMVAPVCGGIIVTRPDHSMPNSLVTFNNFWSPPAGSAPGTPPDATAAMAKFYGTSLLGQCALTPDPPLQ
jgi:hypothetical protein